MRARGGGGGGPSPGGATRSGDARLQSASRSTEPSAMSGRRPRVSAGEGAPRAARSGPRGPRAAARGDGASNEPRVRGAGDAIGDDPGDLELSVETLEAEHHGRGAARRRLRV